MTALRVTPAHGHGGDRLYVSLPNGSCVAWFDRGSGRISLLTGVDEAEVMAALAPFVTGSVTVGPPPVPTAADLARLSLHPDDDLAPNRPGEALLVDLDRGAPSRRLLRADPRRAELAAHQEIGAALDGLEGAGWRALHCVPLPGGARVDHLLIGPAGVLVLRTLAAHRARVRAADPLVAVGRGEPLPWIRWVRRDAERASHALATAVRPVLAVVGASRLELIPPPVGVRVLEGGEIQSVLARAGGVLKPADIESLYAVARDRRTWLRA
ncbi:nuclease-related domain-containing protein [Streptomyces sp. NPDC001941]|uniref:nuclease-related domain-containing protein n=1 Tax=Streptomyces sp. NPDC001941 TaxID=3154659 RepID=UPI00331F34E0